MKLKLLSLIVSCLILIAGCKKEHIDPSKLPPISNPIVTPLVSNIKVDSVTQSSFNVYYQLSISPVTTGIKWAPDSLQLLDTTKGTKVIATLSNNYYKYSFSGLETSSKYYFKIFATDKDGKTTYSSIYNQAMRTYSILLSPFIVAGPASLNYRTSPLIVSAYINDTTHANYSIKLNGIPTTIFQFINYPGSATTNIIINVPPTLELGNTQLEVAYKGKIVYTSNVTIVNGGLLTVTHHPGIFAGGTFFSYNNQLYTCLYDASFYPNDTRSFWRWTPSTDTWVRLPDPTNDAIINRCVGYPINGVVYFGATYNYLWNSTDTTQNSYDEILTTYTPATGKWQDINVYHTNIRAQGEGVNLNDCFVYNNKFYCIFQGNTKGIDNFQGESITIIKVFDPTDKSWQKVMELPSGSLYKAAVLNSKIYLFGTQQNTSGLFTNTFSVLDIINKTLSAKSVIKNGDGFGTYTPYLFAFNNKIYVYGGYSMLGYVSSYNTLFACYDPATDTWEPVASNTYNSAKINQTNGFMFPINGKVYLGLGYDNLSNGSSNTIQNAIYSMYLK